VRALVVAVYQKVLAALFHIAPMAAVVHQHLEGLVLVVVIGPVVELEALDLQQG
jgi:hypothetical protein